MQQSEGASFKAPKKNLDVRLTAKTWVVGILLYTVYAMDSARFQPTATS